MMNDVSASGKEMLLERNGLYMHLPYIEIGMVAGYRDANRLNRWLLVSYLVTTTNTANRRTTNE